MRVWVALKRFYGFSGRELRGLKVLFVLLAALLLLPRFYWIFADETSKLDPEDIREIKQFLSYREVETEPPPLRLFSFDPNATDSFAWAELGFSPRQIGVINNYLAKGGQFRRKEDLQRIFSVTEEDYARVESYISIAPSTRSRYLPDKSPHAGSKPATQKKIRLELNTADSVDLMGLPGIGRVFASRIVRFRDRLGGFYSAAQLLEVYGMDSLRYQGLSDQVFVDTAILERINVNTATENELRSHLYIDYKTASLIVRYRDQHGDYSSPEDLRRIFGISDEQWAKLLPYLKYN